mgnify:CR=1 FL=1
MGMTMTQKILAAHAGLPSVKAGDLIEAKLDMIIQMLTTSGPDGTHVPFVNIPGKSQYHDNMELGEAIPLLFKGSFK